MRDFAVGDDKLAALIAAMMGGVHREQGMPPGGMGPAPAGAGGMPAQPQYPQQAATAQQPQQPQGYDLGRPRRPGDPGWPWLP